MKTKISLLIVTLMITLCCFSQSERGKIIYVPDDYTTIQEAINAANSNDMVLVAEGTYNENIRFYGKPITVASMFIIDGLSKHIANTIIKGPQFSSWNTDATVLFIDGEDTTSVLNGFTITGGNGVLNETYQLRCGGGIYANNAGSKIINNIIYGNNVTGETTAGAGICCIADDDGTYWTIIENNVIRNNNLNSNGHAAFGGGMAIMINSIIRNNLIEFNTCRNPFHQAYGGAIEIQKLTDDPIVSVIEKNTIRHNKTDGINGSFGAGIACFNISPIISDNVFRYNKVTSKGGSKGGAVFIFRSDNGIVIDNNRFENNECFGDYCQGGALMIQQTGRVEIQNNEFFKNSMHANDYAGGGGLWLVGNSDAVDILSNRFELNQAGLNSYGGAIGIVSSNSYLVTLDKNRIVQNSAREGAGLWVYNTYRMNLCNNIFSRNAATYLGGAIRFAEFNSNQMNNFMSDVEEHHSIGSRALYRPAISNNNFVDNSSFKGGAIYSDYLSNVPVIFNSIFCSNSAMVGRDVRNDSDVELAVFHCLVDTDRLSGVWTGQNNILCDPMLESDCTHLCWDSECTNAGISALYYDYTLYECADLDIDMEERPYSGTDPDIGADETAVPFMLVNTRVFSVIESGFEVYPNPVMNKATVAFELDQEKHVEIIVRNASGVVCERINSSVLEKGKHQFECNTMGLPAGVYTIEMMSESQNNMRKIVVMK